MEISTGGRKSIECRYGYRLWESLQVVEKGKDVERVQVLIQVQVAEMGTGLGNGYRMLEWVNVWGMGAHCLNGYRLWKCTKVLGIGNSL